jgi:hypothetical protein
MCEALNEGANKQCYYTQPRRMGMNQYALTLASILLTFFCSIMNLVQEIQCATLETRTIGLTIINNTGNVVLITFKRSISSPERSKLLEAGESIDFGTVYEASVQSYSTLWGYIAPAKQVLFSAGLLRFSKSVTHLVICIKGIVGRSIFHPFGQWDYDIFVGKKLIAIPADSYEQVKTVLDAFPTAKRKIMYTPRYILGLPQHSQLDDALEACLMLESKWNSMDTVDAKLVSDVMYMIEEARKAFMNDQADVPLHIPVDMRTQGSCEKTEVTYLAWS